MITIISGTNRVDSISKKVSYEYQRFLADREIEAQLLLLDETDMLVRNPSFIAIEENILQPTEKFIIISPEYNGSYPGILKLMIDNTQVSKVWWHKKVLLTGVSTGRAGNLRGMEHLTGCLLHMKMLVHPNRLPISVVDKLMNSDNQFTDLKTIAAINNQLEEFINF
ncbi:MAG: NAD(P)H-dependent oxidoreductase [Ferruginibacter sp.]